MRYCEMCDKAVTKKECPACGSGTVAVPTKKLTRQEQLEGLADRGVDTWEEYRCER